MRIPMPLHAAGALVAIAMASTTATAQTTAPRTLQAPTQEELLQSCKSGSDAKEKQQCEERVRAGGAAGKGTRNKSVAQQQAEQSTANRGVEDPGTSSTSPSSTANDPSARTRSDRVRMSQRSESVKTAPESKARPNSVTSTDAAPARTTDESGARASGDEEQRKRKNAERRTPPDSNAEEATDAPKTDRGESRPNEHQ